MLCAHQRIPRASAALSRQGIAPSDRASGAAPRHRHPAGRTRRTYRASRVIIISAGCEPTYAEAQGMCRAVPAGDGGQRQLGRPPRARQNHAKYRRGRVQRFPRPLDAAVPRRSGRRWIWCWPLRLSRFRRKRLCFWSIGAHPRTRRPRRAAPVPQRWGIPRLMCRVRWLRCFLGLSFVGDTRPGGDQSTPAWIRASASSMGRVTMT